MIVLQWLGLLGESYRNGFIDGFACGGFILLLMRIALYSVKKFGCIRGNMRADLVVICTELSMSEREAAAKHLTAFREGILRDVLPENLIEYIDDRVEKSLNYLEHGEIDPAGILCTELLNAVVIAKLKEIRFAFLHPVKIFHIKVD